MLRVTDLVLARGTKRLLDGANLTVHAGHKVGLVAIKPRVGVSWILRGLSAWRLFQEVRRRVPLERLSSLQR